MAFNRLHTALWSKREISSKTKSGVYTAVVWTIILYGCETWPLLDRMGAWAAAVEDAVVVIDAGATIPR